MNNVQSIQLIQAQQPTKQPSRTVENVPSFSTFLKRALEEVNTIQQESAAITNKLITGQVEDLHQVSIAAAKADVALQLTVQVRNKAVEAYQEIMRMQM